MEITIQQVKALDYHKLVKFITTLSLKDLQILRGKFDTFISLLFANKLETTELFSKTMSIVIEINCAIDDLNGVVDTSNGKILKVVK